MTFRFDKPIPKKHIIVGKEHSKHGAAIVLLNTEIAAICGDCRHLLGWTFTRETPRMAGFWSCLEGCHRTYANELEATTSSLLSVTDSRLDRWLSGWLGVPSEAIEIKIKE